METTELLHIQSLLKDLEKKIEDLAKIKIVQPEPTESELTHELATALAKAQSEFKIAGLNKSNPYFKSSYADLQSIIEASRSALCKNNLAVTQQILQLDDGQSLLVTTLRHSSGQWICSRSRIVPPKNDIQTISSYITYLKRISYAALIGVVAGDEDDDAEAAVATTRQTFAKGTALNTKYNPKENLAEVVTKEQLEELEYELAEYPDIAEMVLDGLKILSLADMPKTKFMQSIQRVREIKNLRNGATTPKK